MRDMSGVTAARAGTSRSSSTTTRQVGVNLCVLGPGDPMAMYHWEADQEGFLVLSGEAILIVDGEERTIRQWDYVHCPPASRTRRRRRDGPCHPRGRRADRHR